MTNLLRSETFRKISDYISETVWLSTRLLEINSSYILFSFFCACTSINGMEEAEKSIIAYKGSEPETIGLQGISYRLCPEQQPCFIAQQGTSFHLTSDSANQCTFTFKQVEGQEGHYFVTRTGSDSKLSFQKQGMCLINTQSAGQYTLEFKAHKDDQRGSYLGYQGDNVRFVDTGTSWHLQPAYEINLAFGKIDLDTMLFKLPKRDPISNVALSVSQICQIYECHFKAHCDNRDLMIAHETPEYVYAYTPHNMNFIQGLSIFAEGFPLKVSNVRGFDLCNDDSRNSFVTCDRDFIELKQGQRLLLRANYNRALPALGKVELIPGTPSSLGYWASWLGSWTHGWLGHWGTPTYNHHPVTLKSILHNFLSMGTVSDQPCASYVTRYNSKDPSILVTNTRSNIVLNPGPAGMIADVMLRRLTLPILEVANNLNTLSGSVVQFGENIERSSEKISNALEKSSFNLSVGAIYFSRVLGRSVTNASGNFHDAIKMLSATALKVSGDINENLPAVLNTTRDSMKLLNETLIESSVNLKDSARDVSVALEESARLFRASLEDFNRASENFVNGSGDLSRSIDGASKSFIEGMSKLEVAAHAVKNTNHQIVACVLQ